jgi:hypothetical protein
MIAFIREVAMFTCVLVLAGPMIAFIREVAMFTCVLVLAGFISDAIKSIKWGSIRRWVNSFRGCRMCGRLFVARHHLHHRCDRCLEILSRHD